MSSVLTPPPADRNLELVYTRVGIRRVLTAKKMTRCPDILLLVTANMIAVACSGRMAPIEVAAGCPEQPLRGAEQWASEPVERLIDDFENRFPDLPKIGGRDGSWVIGDDGTGGTFTAESSATCAARGLRAGHFAGKGFTSWGANWDALFRRAVDGTAVPYDGRPYGGVSFWAAVGPAAEEPFDVPVGIMTMDNIWNGNICTRCEDMYSTIVHPSSTWQRFSIRFSDLAQHGFGAPLVAMRRDQLVGFMLWPDHAFDIWIDDVRFEP